MFVYELAGTVGTQHTSATPSKSGRRLLRVLWPERSLQLAVMGSASTALATSTTRLALTPHTSTTITMGTSLPSTASGINNSCEELRIYLQCYCAHMCAHCALEVIESSQTAFVLPSLSGRHVLGACRQEDECGSALACTVRILDNTCLILIIARGQLTQQLKPRHCPALPTELMCRSCGLHVQRWTPTTLPLGMRLC